MKGAAISWLSLLLICQASAQDTVAIFFDYQQRAADTLDFGYVLAGDTVLRQLFIENTTSAEAVIPQGIRPYFWIEATPPYRDNDPDEFPLEALFPFRISSGQTRMYPLRYTATLFAQHPEGRHQVALGVSVRQSDDTARIVGHRRLILRATKSFRPLWADVLRLDFDSVYVSSPFVRTQPLLIRNVSRISVPARIVRQGDLRSLAAFYLDADSSDFFAQEAAKDYHVQFQPRVPGLHALDVLFIHPSPLRGGADDTTTVPLRGVGVVQRLQCRHALSNNVIITGDTIVLQHRRIGTTDTVTLVFENTGNVPIGAVQTLVFQQSTLAEISLLKGFNVQRALQPQQFDTVIFAVHPLREGIVHATLELQTDLQQRSIFGVPPGAAIIRFPIRIESIPQRLVALRREINWGTLLTLAECNNEQYDTLQFINQSNEPVTITAIVMPPPLRTTLPTPLVVEPGHIVAVPIIVTPPRDSGSLSAIVQLVTTDTAYSPLEIRVQAHFVRPIPPTLQLPSAEYVPGEPTFVAVRCDSSAWMYSALSFDVALDPTMAELSSVLSTGTASQQATIQVETVGDGVYRVTVTSRANLLPHDTLVVLRLQTYIGQQSLAPMSIVRVRAGVRLCPDVVSGSGGTAQLRVVPFCGMHYKFPIFLPPIVIGAADVLPDGMLQVDYWSKLSQPSELLVYAGDGRLLIRYVVELQAGRNTFVVPFGLPAGMYAIRLRSIQSLEGAQRVLLVH